jgi:excisionase family DNA binding protein
MATAVLGSTPIAAEESERPALRKLDQLFESQRLDEAAFVARGVSPTPLPESALRLLHQIFHQLAQGHVVTIVPSEKMLTTNQAAALLNVSRPHLVQLLDRGGIPYEKVGTHRRVRYEDLKAYKLRRDMTRQEGLAELTQLSDEYGLYDPAVAGKKRR